MRKQYDVADATRNPYGHRLTQLVTIQRGEATIDSCKQGSGDVGVAYRTLIDLDLPECAEATMQ